MLLEEEMATHSNIFAWRIPWTEEPSRLQSMGLQRVRHQWSDLAHMHAHTLYKGSLSHCFLESLGTQAVCMTESKWFNLSSWGLQEAKMGNTRKPRNYHFSKILYPLSDLLQLYFNMQMSYYSKIQNRIWLHYDFPGGSESKSSAYNTRDLGSIPGSGRSPGEGNGNPLQ